MRRCSAMFLIGCILLVLGGNSAQAVTDEEVFRDFRFNFINPGGRALAMGGAIIADVQDATAAQSNPAGLTALSSAQFFSEIRYADADSSTASNSSDFPGSEFNIRGETDPDASTSPSFLSYVHPFRRLRVAVSRQEVLNNESQTISRSEIFQAGVNDIRTGTGEIDVLLVHWNVSVGYKITEAVRIGATVTFGELDMDSRLVNTYEDPTGTILGGGLAGVPIEMFVTETDDSDTDVFLSAGLLWTVLEPPSGSAPKPGRPKLSVGGVYRQGGDFELDQTLTAQDLGLTTIPGIISSTVFFNETGNLLTPGGETSAPFANELHVPDVFGVGVAYQPLERLAFTLDVVRTEWSDLIEGFNSRLNLLTAGWPTEEEAKFTVDDQTNVHFGVEYAWAPSTQTSYRFRAGYHEDKDHRIRADFPNGATAFGLGNNGIFPGGDDEDHFSAGVGFVLGNRFQLDVAGDFSDNSTEALTSLTVNF